MKQTIHDILKRFREEAAHNRDLGDKFERLVTAFLTHDPLQAERFSDVWLWTEWPGRGNQPDTGIDLVARDRYTGEYCAIQCKFFAPGHKVQKIDLDSFFTASGKKPFTSRMIVATTEFGIHAEEALVNQQPPVQRLRVEDLEASAIDWEKFSFSRPDKTLLRPKKKIRPHQKSALETVMQGLAAAERGKLIMACGTGKTFTALKIAEEFAKGKKPWHGDGYTSGGRILFMVPSIALLSQSLLEWATESEMGMHCFAVCSDTAVGKSSDTEDMRLHDLPFPATTDSRKLAGQMNAFAGKRPLTVVFSTYQSIQAISDAQTKYGAPAFDLVVCDEAHRTTGVTLAGTDESHFVKIHNAEYIKATKRLYMTATPRIFSESSQAQAEEKEAIVCSMDNPELYGEELHRLGFGEAVGSGLLADYKVMVLAVDEKFVSKAFQSQLSVAGELSLDDAVKITGCWNGLSKRMAKAVDGGDLSGDDAPMRRAVAFSRSIKDSKRLTELFQNVVKQYTDNALASGGIENPLSCEVDHVDGTMNALVRSHKLDWLKANTDGDGIICRILSNARCLSEGVDVPALDAVMFLNPRNSVVDVVQSVGRVMRISKGKKYGYIILPIGIPADVSPEEALKDNQKYKVVWQVLQALRAHDDRFNATVNKIDLNKKRPENIQIIGVSGGDAEGSGVAHDISVGQAVQIPLPNFPHLEEWRDAIFAKIVLKCGDRRYWESWAKDVSAIAARHVTRIEALVEGADAQHRKEFDKFLSGLRKNLNPGVSESDAIEMLAQHIITKPVFDALFEGYEFTKKNPVSKSMQAMLEILEKQALEREQKSLDKFYASVRERAEGVDNVEGRQRIIIELYDKFFRNAFPRTADRLGIVYTPVEVVDFIIRSADVALRQEFGVGLSDRGVHILDPFTGTGTFIVRLLQSDLLKPKNLAYKYEQELHANEIILLAYYIAAVNIEEAYHRRASSGGYKPFEGIVLADTFQLREGTGQFDQTFQENSKRATRQNEIDIRVIVGNPPYSAQQDSANDGNKNVGYPALDERIRSTYAVDSGATNAKNLYDSYIRAIRWASDRVQDKGVVCYVTNGSFIDSNNMDGLRKCLTDEFSSIYVFNLRGNQRTSGETSRQEGGKIFGSGSRASIAITLLVKNPVKRNERKLFYHDIGDYLSREEKLAIVSEFQSVAGIPWKQITPNNSQDWINQRDPAFDKFLSLGDKSSAAEKSIFANYSQGILTARDAWAYNFSKEALADNMGRMIEFYNKQVRGFIKYSSNLPPPANVETRQKRVDEFVDNDSTKISWTRGLKNGVGRGDNYSCREDAPTPGYYRPFCRQWLYSDRQFNEYVSLMPMIFPRESIKNLGICVGGIGANKEFSVLLTDCLTDYEMISKGQCFPLFTYEKIEEVAQPSFFNVGDKTIHNGYYRRENITDDILVEFRRMYSAPRGAEISKEDIFYYVYGVLHSPEYKKRFEANLKKMLPRIPYARDFWAFSKAGRELAKWHLNYESVDPYPLGQGGELDMGDPAMYRVQKMQWAKKGKEVDKTSIVFNGRIQLTGIPLEAYGYIVNGKSAIEWVMERYQLSVDKDSGIENDPNDWTVESGDPEYILNLLKRMVSVSLETVKIVESLPALKERNAASS